MAGVVLRQPRPPAVASRFDGDGQGATRARAVVLMLYALRGTPFVYQGEELGLPDAEIPPDRVVDVDGRDPERAPIPWGRRRTPGPARASRPASRGCRSSPTPSAERRAQAADPGSTLRSRAGWRSCARARPRCRPARSGALDPARTSSLGTGRRTGALVVAVNFAAAPVAPRGPRTACPAGPRFVVSTDPARAGGDVAARRASRSPLARASSSGSERRADGR